MNLFRFFSVILTFYCVVFSGVKSDTSYISGGSYTERLHTPSAGITRANIDTSHSRHATADSATIPVLKGTKTFRDSSYFAGGLRGLRLYMRTASVDTLYTNIMGLGTTTPQHRLHVNGNIRATAGNIGISNSVTSPTGEWYFYVGSDKSIGLKDNISNTFPIIIDSGAGNYGIRIVRGGLIGVKTNTPDSNLTVGGSAHVTGNARIDGTATATQFSGPLTGNVTGNVSGSSGSCTGNANTATTATNLSGGSVSATTCNSTAGYQINGGDFLSVYDTGSFACTVKVETNGFTSQRIGKMSYCVIGSSVTASFDTSLVGTISSGGTYLNIYATIPQTIIPSRNKVVGIPNVLNNNVGGNGLMTIKTDGMITVGVVGYFEGGLCGVVVSTGHSTSFSYNKN